MQAIKIISKKQQGGNESNIFNQEMGAINSKLLENKCITPTQHKKNNIKN